MAGTPNTLAGTDAFTNSYDAPGTGEKGSQEVFGRAIQQLANSIWALNLHKQDAGDSSVGGLRWIFANAADRLSEVVTSDEVQSLAFQSDTKSLWVAVTTGTGAGPWAEVAPTDLPDPTLPGGIATKHYVDNLGGLPFDGVNLTPGSTNLITTVVIPDNTSCVVQVECTVRNNTTLWYSAMHSKKFLRVGGGGAQVTQVLDPTQTDGGLGLSLDSSKLVASGNNALVQFNPAGLSLRYTGRVYVTFTPVPAHA